MYAHINDDSWHKSGYLTYVAYKGGCKLQLLVTRIGADFRYEGRKLSLASACQARDHLCIRVLDQETLVTFDN